VAAADSLADEDVHMSTISFAAQNGQVLHVGNIERDRSGLAASYDATLTVAGGSVLTTRVEEYGCSLPVFFRELAVSWRGFEGTKSYSSLEGQLTIDATHDGLGTVYCEVSIGQVWPPEWQLSAVLDFGGGADMERIASEVEHVLGG
jgi:hypothetical protein